MNTGYFHIFTGVAGVTSHTVSLCQKYKVHVFEFTSIAPLDIMVSAEQRFSRKNPTLTGL